MDDNDYELMPLELHNCFARRNKTQLWPETLHIHPFMLSLLKALVKARPLWTFISTSSGNVHDGRRTFYSFRVYQGDEHLGALSKEYRHHGDSYTMENRRLSDKRQRSGRTATTDVKKAIKITLKEFGAKTVSELVTDARAQIAKVVTNRHTETRNPVVWAKQAMMTSIIEHTLSIPSLLNAIPMQGKAADARDSYYNKVEAEKPYGEIALALAANSGVQVLTLPNGSYVVIKPNAYTPIESKDLPDNIRQGIGMLKLVEIGIAISEVGIRVAPDMYYLLSTMEDPSSVKPQP